MIVRTDLLRGNEVISQCKTPIDQMKTNISAQFEISIDGVLRKYRDQKDIALESAKFLKSRNPNSVVKLKDLQMGEEVIVAFKAGIN